MKDLPKLEKAKYKKYVPVKRGGVVYQQLRTVGTEDMPAATATPSKLFEKEKEIIAKYNWPLTNERDFEHVLSEYTPFVSSQVNRFMQLRSLPASYREDLEQEGQIGAYQAVKTFDPSKGQNLTARVSAYVQNAMQSHTSLASGKHAYEDREKRKMVAYLSDNPHASREELMEATQVSAMKAEEFLSSRFQSAASVEDLSSHPAMLEANEEPVSEYEAHQFFQGFESKLSEPEKQLFQDVIDYKDGQITLKNNIAGLQKKYNTYRSVIAERVAKVAVKLLDQLPESTIKYYAEVEPKTKPREQTFLYLMGRSLGISTLDKKYQKYTIHKSIALGKQEKITMVIIGLLIRLVERARLEESLGKSLISLAKSLESFSEIGQSLEQKNIQLKSAESSTLPFLVQQQDPTGQIPKSFKPIRIKQRKSDLFKTFKVLPLKESVNVVLGEYKKSRNVYQIQSLEFNTNPVDGDVWDLKAAKEFEKTNKASLKSFKVVL